MGLQVSRDPRGSKASKVSNDPKVNRDCRVSKAPLVLATILCRLPCYAGMK